MCKKFLTALVLLLNVSLAVAQDNGARLQGTPISSPCMDYGSGPCVADYAFDGNPDTYYASQERSHTWVGLDLGAPHVITRVGWMSRTGWGQRVQLGVFEGSNREDFLDAVPLYVIPEAGTDGTLLTSDVRVTRGFRYVRYVGPNDVRCNVAELAFWGEAGEGKDSLFYQVTQLPTVSIHTYSGNEPMDKVNEVESNITITYHDGTLIQEYPILARGRGNASWNFPKKPYRIKFNDGKKHHMLKDSP
ncbi:MAG: discoidin domain-containing protein, partial [Bacteroidaceae bacterium]|nr:discoidin domain-containing protein [Bacteroidaceae bacterium]